MFYVMMTIAPRLNGKIRKRIIPCCTAAEARDVALKVGDDKSNANIRVLTKDPATKYDPASHILTYELANDWLGGAT